MAARVAYRRFLTQLGNYLQSEGFESDGETFRLKSPNDDYLIVNIQKSSASSMESVEFYVELGLMIAPFWAREKRRRKTLTDDSKPTATDGIWRRRLAESTHGGTWRWQLQDTQTAAATLDEVRGHLESELPDLKRLLDRRELLRIAIEEKLLGYAATNVAGWLIASREGPSHRLRQHLASSGKKPGSPMYDAIWEYALESGQLNDESSQSDDSRSPQ